MGTGLILLLLLAALFAFGVFKVRRRMGLGMTHMTWITVIVGFVILVLVTYVAQQP